MRRGLEGGLKEGFKGGLRLQRVGSFFGTSVLVENWVWQAIEKKQVQEPPFGTSGLDPELGAGELVFREKGWNSFCKPKHEVAMRETA